MKDFLLTLLEPGFHPASH